MLLRCRFWWCHFQLGPAFANFRQISSQARKSSCPKGERCLVAYQTHNIKTYSNWPLISRFDSKPAKRNGNGNDGWNNQDIRSPMTKVGKCSQDQKDESLQGKGNSIYSILVSIFIIERTFLKCPPILTCQQYNRFYRPVGACPVKSAIYRSGSKEKSGGESVCLFTINVSDWKEDWTYLVALYYHTNHWMHQ